MKNSASSICCNFPASRSKLLSVSKLLGSLGGVPMPRMHVSPRFALSLCVSLFFTLHTGLAQDARATLTGTVVDQQGAAVPRAAVTAKNLATNVEIKTITDQAGLYVLPFIATGAWSVTVVAQGFKTDVIGHIDLTIGERRQLDFKLTIGGVNDKVTVTANADLLQTGNASHETLMDEQKIQDLPLLGKNTYTRSEERRVGK